MSPLIDEFLGLASTAPARLVSRGKTARGRGRPRAHPSRAQPTLGKFVEAGPGDPQRRALASRSSGRRATHHSMGDSSSASCEAPAFVTPWYWETCFSKKLDLATSLRESLSIHANGFVSSNIGW